MKINKLTITIDNFDDDAMQEDATHEVQRILREISKRIDRFDALYDCGLNAMILRDSNGNRVGHVSTTFPPGEPDEGDGCQTCNRLSGDDYTIGCPGCEAHEHADDC